MNDKYVVVVVTYNRLTLLKECIDCILKQEYQANQIIVINNASNDGTEEYLSTLNKDKFLIVNEKTNLGGAGGFYEGIKIASQLENDWILIIDDDAMLSSNYIKSINDFYITHRDILAFSGTVKTGGKIVTDHRRRMVKSRCIGEVHVPEAEYSLDFFEYNLSTFCGLIVNKTIVKKIGLPRLDFFIQYDDTEYSMRINEHTKIINVNKATLNHKTTLLIENTSHNSKWNWKIYYGTRNKIYSCIKHGYKLVILNYIIRIIGGSIKDLFNPNIPKNVSHYNIKMIFDAVNSGIQGNLGKNGKYLP